MKGDSVRCRMSGGRRSPSIKKVRAHKGGAERTTHVAIGVPVDVTPDVRSPAKVRKVSKSKQKGAEHTAHVAVGVPVDVARQ